nr:hypothetical protein [uncultured Dyadobacter sp.]
MNKRSIITALLLQFLATTAPAQEGFKVVPLGVKGGTMDGNLSAYMLAPAGSDAYVCLDAGTVSNGIEKATGKAGPTLLMTVMHLL